MIDSSTKGNYGNSIKIVLKNFEAFTTIREKRFLNCQNDK
jgi:uncharacterized protein YgbK (DUF1537 family)